MVKRLHLGRAAEGGVLAARLAQRGYEGPRNVLEGALRPARGVLRRKRSDAADAGAGPDLRDRARLLQALSLPRHRACAGAAPARFHGQHGFGGDDIPRSPSRRRTRSCPTTTSASPPTSCWRNTACRSASRSRPTMIRSIRRLLRRVVRDARVRALAKRSASAGETIKGWGARIDSRSTTAAPSGAISTPGSAARRRRCRPSSCARSSTASREARRSGCVRLLFDNLMQLEEVKSLEMLALT